MMADKTIAMSLYSTMLRIRMVEEKIVELYPEQEMRCPVHLCIGQEAIAAGVCAHLSEKDYLMSNHRSHGHYLAKGGSLKAMFAEIYGKAAGCSKGKGGSMHLVDLDVGIMGTTPIVAGSIPVAVGVAFGSALKGEDRITVAFFGDAATEEGVFCESLNFAALKKLPVLFVCENNYFSVYSPLSVRQPAERDNLALVKAYGIAGERGDGNNVLEVYRATGKAVQYLRNGKGPYYLEFDTYRWREHCGPNYDNDLGYRTEEEFLRWRHRCPADNFERYLVQEGYATPEKIIEIKKKISREIDEAVTFAKQCPFPDAGDAFIDVYA
ncbi:MAG: thiamine pyrophosphate-dependent dehydrogenase E1 component subunit alpha [Proteobacteria bacterium]|nr:thiamine pyrophosphate-dependent dehydrogenase E1 component subunit alpha [Pseudomonadota bacterium]